MICHWCENKVWASEKILSFKKVRTLSYYNGQIIIDNGMHNAGLRKSDIIKTICFCFFTNKAVLVKKNASFRYKYDLK